MININGLTSEQVDMLDIIWAFDTKEEYNDWLENLDIEEYNMCRGLMELLTLAILDESLENRGRPADRYKEANKVINQVKSKLTQNK
jgi:predicted lipase